jgi:peroxiredoxin
MFILAFLSILAFSFGSFGQTGQKNKKVTTSKKSEPTEQNTIIQLEKDFYKAKLENNVSFMDEILSKDCISTNQFGNVKDKSSFLLLWKTFKMRTFTLDSVKVVLINDTTAIASGLVTQDGNQMTFAHNLIKQKGKWQILSMVQKYPEFKNLQGMGSYRITGYLKGAEGVAISLLSRNRAPLNAAIVKDGKFIMEGKPIEYPDMVFLTTPSKMEQATFFLENSEIILSGTLDSLSKVKVTGSKTQDEYYSFLTKREASRDKILNLIKEGQSASQNMDTAKISQIRKEMEEINQQQVMIEKEFVVNNPKSFAVPIIFNNLFRRLTTEESESIIKSLDPGVARTQIVVSIIERVAAIKAVDIGKKAPDFDLNDVNDVPVALSSLKGHKLLLIDFWAAWCKPCRVENPHVVKVYNEFNGKGFEILGVSLDRRKEDWVKAIADDKLIWKQVSDLKYFNSPVAIQYNVTSIPANFLLDEKGTIIAKNLRGEELYNKIKSVLDSE